MANAASGDRVATAGLGVLGVVVLGVAVVALRHPDSSHAAAPPHATSSVSTHAAAGPSRRAASSTPAPTPLPGTTTSAAPQVDVRKTPIVIMNNTTTTGLAAGAKQRFESAGWTVSSIGTMSNNVVSTCAYYDPAVKGSRHVAKALRREFPTIKRVARRFAELPPGPVVLVLTWDYSPG